MVLGVLGDRTLDEDPTLPVPFLGAAAAFPLGPMRLAAMLKRPVLFMTGLYLGGNRYAIHFEPLADFTGIERDGARCRHPSAVVAYAACLERHCRAAALQLVQFLRFLAPDGCRLKHDPTHTTLPCNCVAPGMSGWRCWSAPSCRPRR